MLPKLYTIDGGPTTRQHQEEPMAPMPTNPYHKMTDDAKEALGQSLRARGGGPRLDDPRLRPMGAVDLRPDAYAQLQTLRRELRVSAGVVVEAAIRLFYARAIRPFPAPASLDDDAVRALFDAVLPERPTSPAGPEAFDEGGRG